MSAAGRASDVMRAATGAAWALWLACGACAADVVLRDGTRVPEPIEVVSIEGLTVRTGATPRVIGWHEVLSLGGARAGDAASFMPMADRAWRARARLARGDVALAGPLFESLFTELRGRSGPTALMVAEGALHCRLSRRDVGGAAEAWLEAVRLRQPAGADGEARIPGAGGEPVGGLLDPLTLVCPALPPVFATAQAERALQLLGDGGTATEPAGGDAGVSGAMRALYRRAAEHDAGRTPSATESSAAWDHAGVRFVADLVLARTSADPREREIRRNRLRIGLDADVDTWREAWARAAIGLSLIDEGGESNLLLGALELLHLPARFETTQPQLAGIALSRAAMALERAGHPSAAAALLGELRARHADHPAIQSIGPGPDEPAAEPGGGIGGGGGEDGP